MPTAPTFLVVGNAVAETVTRTEDGARRGHAGGVGAIMARELALAGADATLLTSAVPVPSLDTVREHLTLAGVTLEADTGNPPQKMHGQIHIRCRRGEFAGASGEWVRMGGLGARIRELAPHYDVTLVSMNLLQPDLAAALASARLLVTNATSPKLAARLLSQKGQAAATLNTRELGAVRARLRTRPTPEELPRTLGADAVLLTKGPAGMTLYQEDAPARTAAATPPPAGADYIGAGDAATAGLAWALAHGEEPPPAAARFAAALIERNAASYRTA